MQPHFKAESSNRNANTSFANAAEPSRPPVDKMHTRAEPIRAPPEALGTPVEVFHERVEHFNRQFAFFLQPESVKLSARNSHACETPPVFRACESIGNGPRQRRSFRVGCMRPSKRAGDEENVTEEICTVRPSAGDTVLLRHNGNGLEKCECRSANYEVQSVRHSKLLIRHSPRRLHALLEMRHQVGGHQRDAFRIAHQRRGKCECRSAKSEVQSVRHSEFVIRHFPLRGLVGDGALDVVDGNVIAEDRPRVRVRLLDGRAGEADERRIRQGIAQVAGEAQMKPPAISVHRESPWRSRQSQPDRVVEHGQV